MPSRKRKISSSPRLTKKRKVLILGFKPHASGSKTPNGSYDLDHILKLMADYVNQEAPFVSPKDILHWIQLHSLILSSDGILTHHNPHNTRSQARGLREAELNFDEDVPPPVLTPYHLLDFSFEELDLPQNFGEVESTSKVAAAEGDVYPSLTPYHVPDVSFEEIDLPQNLEEVESTLKVAAVGGHVCDENDDLQFDGENFRPTPEPEVLNYPPQTSMPIPLLVDQPPDINFNRWTQNQNPLGRDSPSRLLDMPTQSTNDKVKPLIPDNVKVEDDVEVERDVKGDKPQAPPRSTTHNGDLQDVINRLFNSNDPQAKILQDFIIIEERFIEICKLVRKCPRLKEFLPQLKAIMNQHDEIHKTFLANARKKANEAGRSRIWDP